MPISFFERFRPHNTRESLEKVEKIKVFGSTVSPRIAKIGEDKGRGVVEARDMLERLYVLTKGKPERVTDAMIIADFDKFGPKTEVLEDLRENLTRGAHQAYGMQSPEGRSVRMEEAVASEASLAVKEMHQRDPNFDGVNFQKLEDVFYTAGSEAVQAYHELDISPINEDGTQKTEEQIAQERAQLKPRYDVAHDDALAVNRSHLDELARMASPEMTGAQLQEAIDTLDFRDVMAIVARQLGMALPEEKSAQQIKEILADENVVDATDHFRPRMNAIPISAPGTRSAISPTVAVGVELAIRLANVTWKTTQVHRAHWEQKTDRIDHTKREVFDVFDLLKKEQFDRIKEKMGEEAALYRVAYELWKDVQSVMTPQSA